MFLTNLDNLMKANGYNKNSLAKESGIPYTTIVGFYTKGTDNLKLSTLRKLAAFFNVSLDYLICGETADDKKTPPPLTAEENKLLESFRKLNTNGKQEAVRRVEELTEISKYSFSAQSSADEAI